MCLGTWISERLGRRIALSRLGYSGHDPETNQHHHSGSNPARWDVQKISPHNQSHDHDHKTANVQSKRHAWRPPPESAAIALPDLEAHRSKWFGSPPGLPGRKKTHVRRPT